MPSVRLSSPTTLKEPATKAFLHGIRSLSRTNERRYLALESSAGSQDFPEALVFFNGPAIPRNSPPTPSRRTSLSRFLRLLRRNLGQFADVTYLTTLEIASINRRNSDNFYRDFLPCFSFLFITAPERKVPFDLRDMRNFSTRGNVGVVSGYYFVQGIISHRRGNRIGL